MSDIDIPFGENAPSPLRSEPTTEEEWEAFWDTLERELRQRRRARITNYDSYLRSPEWRRTRELTLDYYGDRCCLCNGTEALQVHHRTYARLGAERLHDLIVLCRSCHQRYHQAA